VSLENLGRSATWGIAFLVAVEVVATIVAKAVSSPQTTELNPVRANTLMKWVNIGVVEAAVIIAVAVYVDRRNIKPIVYGALTEGAITYAEYLYARKCSLVSDEPGTETYG
jgi:hypothetical protein